MSGHTNLAITVCDFAPRDRIVFNGRQAYALADFGSARAIYIFRRKSFLPDDTKSHDLLNGELPDPMDFIIIS